MAQKPPTTEKPIPQRKQLAGYAKGGKVKTVKDKDRDDMKCGGPVKKGGKGK